MDETLRQVVLQTLQVTLLVFFMMILVAVINVWTRGRLAAILQKGICNSRWIRLAVTS